jgi:riboflavin synthase
MFTGIIESTGTVTDVYSHGTNKTFWVQSPISAELSVDQSVSHNGVCLTVEGVVGAKHRLIAVEETLKKTNLNNWAPGTVVNLERCLKMNGRLDGHIVQGHVDTTAECTSIINKEGSWEFSFVLPDGFSHLIIEKGSIAINGTSLTIFNVGKNDFSVAIVPYTFEHTHMKQLKKADKVNIEFDMIGKYVGRIMKMAGQNL